MTTQQFDYTGIRNAAIGLVKYFGKKVPLAIARPLEGSAVSPGEPWRVNPGTTLTFPFLGPIFTVTLRKYSDPVNDQEQVVYIPGDIVTTPSNENTAILCGPIDLNDRVIAQDYTGKQYYQIVGIQDVTPDNLPVVFICKCKAWPMLIRQPATPFG